jgi:hypothetical protein
VFADKKVIYNGQPIGMRILETTIGVALALAFIPRIPDGFLGCHVMQA